MISELYRIKRKKILVVGDIMLDTYHVGQVKRISPEAPVPVVRVVNTYHVAGGAANVARNLIGLGATPYVIGRLGHDPNGATLEQMFNQQGINHRLVRTDSPTITKTRVIGNHQQVVRLDFEEEFEVFTPQTEQTIMQAADELLQQVDIVVISDYGKGLCTPTICQHIIQRCRQEQKEVVIDPKGKEWSKYQGATIVTPNMKELADVIGHEVLNEDQYIEPAAHEVIRQVGLSSLLVTRSEKGMTMVTAETVSHMPTEAREVYDVSGAGDTVVATLAAARAAHFSFDQAIYLANKAAGVVVGKMGTSPILYRELQATLKSDSPTEKVISHEQLPDLLQQLRLHEKKIVFTNGCFDILHKGHVSYLNQARQLGDVLIIGLNSDASVKRLKGTSRPVNDQEARATVMAALKAVDYVVIFDEDTPYNLIREVKPDVLVKGGDYAIEQIVGREFARQTVTIPFVDGFSTTQTIEKMKR